MKIDDAEWETPVLRNAFTSTRDKCANAVVLYGNTLFLPRLITFWK